MNNGSMNNKITNFGTLCRTYRAAMRLTMTEVAIKIGTSQGTISRIENGEIIPPFEYIKKSMEVYKIESKEKQTEFFLSYLESFEKIEIPLKEMNPLLKECLATICAYKDVIKRGGND
jgi:transcriptional regulator with XRE-family HTH domain